MCAGTARCASAVAADGVHLVATDAHEALLDHLADGPGEYVVVDLAVDGTATALRPHRARRKPQRGGPMSGHPAEVERAYSASKR